MNEARQPLETINTGDPFAMRYWARQLRVTEAELRAAIAATGNKAGAVRHYLGKRTSLSRTGRPQA